MKILPLLLSFLFLLPLVFSEPITDDVLINQAAEDAVFELAPEPYQQFTGYLKNRANKEIIMEIVLDEETLYRLEVAPGAKENFFYTFGKDVDGLSLEINTWDNAQGDYVLDLVIESQDDAGSGGDASSAFRSATPIGLGVYTGFLGGADEKDFFTMDLKAQETIVITLEPDDKASLGLTLIDGSYTTRINTRAQLEGEILTSTFTSPRDQTVYFGVEGNERYTINISSDLQEADNVGAGADMPPPPPSFPETNVETGETVAEKGVDGVSDSELNSNDANGKERSERVSFSLNKSTVNIIVIVLVLFVVLVIASILYKRKQNPTPKKEEKKSKKKKTKK